MLAMFDFVTNFVRHEMDNFGGTPITFWGTLIALLVVSVLFGQWLDGFGRLRFLITILLPLFFIVACAFTGLDCLFSH